MSEKRFIVIDNDFSKWVEDTTYKEDKHEGTLYDVYDMCRKLNELVDKNEQLLFQLNNISAQRDEFLQGVIENSKKIGRLEKENEQLRQTMQKVYKLLEEEVDLFSEKAIEHDIIAYSEMQDFDNKDAYCICTATKKAIQMLKR